MNINIAIVDQRLLSVMDSLRDQAAQELRIVGDDRLRSLAFVFVCVQTVLDLEEEAAFDCLTEGGGDFGVDAVHISEEVDGEFTVSLFQGKYDNGLEGNRNFPENGIEKLIHSIQYIFDPAAQLNHVNRRVRVKIEEIRSLIRDGYLPHVRVLACNNGLPWKSSAQEAIERSGFGSQVVWEHVDHNEIVSILQSTKPVNDTVQLSGLAIVEDMYYSRVLVGRIAVREIASLVERHGERLLERNIRRYLGLQGNRVNESIRETLLSEEKSNFYFFNNGITMTCDKLEYNALQRGDYQVRVGNLQIINGGQTCMTIYKTYIEGRLAQEGDQAYVLLRLYQLPSGNDELVRRITYATNSQNPVDLRDLRANDARQQRLEVSIKQLNYSYRRKRVEPGLRSTDITSGTAAEAVLAVWRQRPHQAKFFAREHFGKLYDIIFTEDLTGAQVVVAVKLYRFAENRRKRPKESDPAFVPYASCFIAMQMGLRLLRDLGVELSQVTHKNFSHIDAVLAFGENEIFSKAVSDIQYSLVKLYGVGDISWQQLSATFRRGDLIDILKTRVEES